jgi:hypothetical protein
MERATTILEAGTGDTPNPLSGGDDDENVLQVMMRSAVPRGR